MLQKDTIHKEGTILKLISDKYSRDIIESILKEPKSAAEISLEIGIELGATYRRIHKLEKENLLKITFRITPDGKKSCYYQSKIQKIEMNFASGRFSVNITQSNLNKNENIDEWHRFPNSPTNSQ